MRRAPLLLFAALLLSACGSSSAAKTPTFQAPKISPYKGLTVPAKTAPLFTLHDDTGRAVSLASRRGGYTLVTFLYTHCPDVCPLIAANLNKALQELPKTNVNVLAVSVDPKGDTPATVRAYVKAKHLVPRFHYLIGTKAQLAPIWKAYDVAAVAANKSVVNHVAYTVLIDPNGKERLFYDAQVHAADVVHDLRTLTRVS
ncbi:MAG TPA: SCO family protein [Gaiellaceae bacterium]